MAIRSGAKAIIIKDKSILLNQCHHSDGRTYYDLPGGGQNQYESIEDAVVREVLEETGLTVRVKRFVALAEEIYTDTDLRCHYPDYAHCLMHIFLAELTETPAKAPLETDYGMEKSVWIPVADVQWLDEVRPPQLKNSLIQILENENPLWLGTVYLDWKG